MFFKLIFFFFRLNIKLIESQSVERNSISLFYALRRCVWSACRLNDRRKPTFDLGKYTLKISSIQKMVGQKAD